MIKRKTFHIKRKKKRRKKGDITKLKSILWQLCRELIRAMYVNLDGSFTCYTCKQKMMFGQRQLHTGHFIVSSLCSTELRYDLKNLRPQCANCNIWKSGNWVIFEQNLIKNHGQEYVAELKKRNEETKGKVYPKEWFQQKIQEYEKTLKSIPAYQEALEKITNNARLNR